MCFRHLEQKDGGRQATERKLYRIFFYDCPPLSKKAHNPLNNRAVDFSKTPLAQFRNELHAQLRKQRKLALRLGHLDENNAAWQLRPDKLKDLLARKIDISDLSPDDVTYYAKQKGVDMRIGLDISSLSYKKHVDQIILVAGDSDFVPAAKLARREGIDFILDSMRHQIRPDLHEHIDGLRSISYKPTAQKGKKGVREGESEGAEVVTASATPATSRKNAESSKIGNGKSNQGGTGAVKPKRERKKRVRKRTS